MGRKLSGLVMLLLIAGFNLVYAQSSPNITFLRSVPQSYVTNPATEVPCRFWIGIPAMSSIGLSFENTGFRYKDVFYRTADDSLHFDVNNFLNTLDKNNFININFNEEILAFGFNTKKYYFDFRLTERFSNSIEYSKDLMSFLFKLNGQFIGQTAEFTGTGLNMTLYHELSFGVRRKIDEKWSTGARFKYLAGVANVYSKKTDMSLFTDPANAYALTVHSDLEIHTSIPGLSNDKADSLSFNNNGKDLRNEMSGVKNPGVAIDLGVQYKPNEKFLFGAGILDLGFINWKNNTRSYVSDDKSHNYTFEGIDINDFIGNDTSSLGDHLQNILDTLTNTLGLKTTYGSYSSSLVTRINLTGQYNAGEKDHFAALLQTSIFNKKLIPALTLHYNHEFGKTLNLMTGYTISKRNFMNLALGFSLKVGAFRWYMISDNAYAFYKPTDFRFTNIQMGFNLVFGDKRNFRKTNPKAASDLPAPSQYYTQSTDTIKATYSIGSHTISYTLIKIGNPARENKNLPIVLFLHGSGERGTDNQKQLNVGLPQLAKTIKEQNLEPCYLLAPQCPNDERWVKASWALLSHTMEAEMNWPLSCAWNLLDSIVKSDRKFDPKRVYVTGLSMGGFGTWELSQRFPDRITAAIPICGGGDTAQTVQLKSLPLWAFHGKIDDVVKVSRTTDMVESINKHSGKAKVTIYDDLGHGCWDRVYSDKEVVKWLFSR